MFEGKKIGVVIPAYNVEKLVGKVLETLPDYVDRAYVVDDASSDKTAEVGRAHQDAAPERVRLVLRERNGGVGAAIASGYRVAVEEGCDVVAVMAGDAQMDPADLARVVGPVCRDEADYVKGNRLFQGESWNLIPKHRYLGNSFLSLLTKVSSGYWHVADSQCGYTAISRVAIERVEPEKIYPRYGMPNDLLIRLNIHSFRVMDVSVRPVYKVGEKSGIRLRKVVFTIPWILFKGFWKRILFKYVVLDFHPLVFFYAMGLLLAPSGLLFGIYLMLLRISGTSVAATSALFAAFLCISGFQALFFAMWFDMEYNRHLK